MYPYIFIFGRTIPSYGLCMAVGIFVACCASYLYVRRQKLDINSMIIIAACIVGLGLLGSKLLYLFVAQEINISSLTGGGQVFYGGLIGGIIGAFLGAHISGDSQRLFLYCDAFVPSIPLGHCFGRVGCFLAGCCYGAPYKGIFAVNFPKVGVMQPVFPVQIFEAGLNLCIFFLLIILRARKHEKFCLLFQYFILYSFMRFFLEFLRGDEVRGIIKGLSTSQLISLCLFILGHAFIILSKKSK